MGARRIRALRGAAKIFRMIAHLPLSLTLKAADHFALGIGANDSGGNGTEMLPDSGSDVGQGSEEPKGRRRGCQRTKRS